VERELYFNKLVLGNNVKIVHQESPSVMPLVFVFKQH
jgi:hypothetical protein